MYFTGELFQIQHQNCVKMACQLGASDGDVSFINSLHFKVNLKFKIGSGNNTVYYGKQNAFRSTSLVAGTIPTTVP